MKKIHLVICFVCMRKKKTMIDLGYRKELSLDESLTIVFLRSDSAFSDCYYPINLFEMKLFSFFFRIYNKRWGAAILVESNLESRDKNAFTLNNNSNEQINQERRVYK